MLLMHFVYYSIDNVFAFEMFNDLISSPLLDIVLQNMIFMYWSTRYH